MEKKKEILLFISLILASVLMYSIHFLIFGDFEHIVNYVITDLAFIPIEVIFVSLIIQKLLDKMERRKFENKIYMIIELFYSEIGKVLLAAFAKNDSSIEAIRVALSENKQWADKDFDSLSKAAAACLCEVFLSCEELGQLKDRLIPKRELLTDMIANTLIQEHDAFSNLIISVFHLMEELTARKDMTQISELDKKHLENDCKRVYGLLMMEWIMYMKHLNREYPFQFSFALRTNPLVKAEKVEF